MDIVLRPDQVMGTSFLNDATFRALSLSSTLTHLCGAEAGAGTSQSVPNPAAVKPNASRGFAVHGAPNLAG